MSTHESQTDPHLGPQIHIRGRSAPTGKASLQSQIGAWTFDLGLFFGILFLVVEGFQIFPLLRPKYLAIALIAGVLVRVALQKFFSASPGQWIWAIQMHKHQALPRKRLQGAELFLPVTATAVMSLGALALAVIAVFNHPVLMSAQREIFAEYIPDLKDKRANWNIIPYYYSNGAWPLRYNGKPVFFAVPYEKGPPNQFLGHIVVRWDVPETRLTLGGPITPVADLKREQLRECLLEGLACVAERKAVLLKTWNEMQKQGFRKWKLSWFIVDNPHIPAEDRPQGIYITAASGRKRQDRVILVNQSGAHQTFVLDTSSAGYPAAKDLFQKAIRSQRVSSDLLVGRAWVDRQLGDVKIERANAQVDPEDFAEKVAKAQAFLLSKISVDPKTLDTYFHLGGTALLLAQQAYKNKNHDWSSAAGPLVYSSFRFAQDIAPQDKRTKALESYWIEVKRY